MPLAPYREPFWYPDNSPASGQKLYVFPRSGPPLAQLWADQAGTIPLPNPLVLPPNGIADCWVLAGDYWGYINGQSYYLVVDLDENLTRVWPATFVHDHPVPETSWLIMHGLTSFPAVSVLDTDDQEIPGVDVQYHDQDSLTISFGAPIAGTAYLRR